MGMVGGRSLLGDRCIIRRHGGRRRVMGILLGGIDGVSRVRCWMRCCVVRNPPLKRVFGDPSYLLASLSCLDTF
jgi:hypothetical protein